MIHKVSDEQAGLGSRWYFLNLFCCSLEYLHLFKKCNRFLRHLAKKLILLLFIKSMSEITLGEERDKTDINIYIIIFNEIIYEIIGQDSLNCK